MPIGSSKSAHASVTTRQRTRQSNFAFLRQYLTPDRGARGDWARLRAARLPRGLRLAGLMVGARPADCGRVAAMFAHCEKAPRSCGVRLSADLDEEVLYRGPGAVLRFGLLRLGGDEPAAIERLGDERLGDSSRAARTPAGRPYMAALLPRSAPRYAGGAQSGAVLA